MISDPLVSTGTQRVFIGIPVDAALQRQIDRFMEPVKDSGTSIRWVPPCNRHLTLAFLGNRPPGETEALLQSCDEAYRGAFRFQNAFTKLDHFPRPSSRLIALTGECGDDLEHLVQLTRALLKNNGVGFDRKPFRPHITLGRNKKANGVRVAIDLPVDVLLTVSSIRIYASTLSEHGSIYTTLKEVQLN